MHGRSINRRVFLGMSWAGGIGLSAYAWGCANPFAPTEDSLHDLPLTDSDENADALRRAVVLRRMRTFAEKPEKDLHVGLAGAANVGVNNMLISLQRLRTSGEDGDRYNYYHPVIYHLETNEWAHVVFSREGLELVPRVQLVNERGEVLSRDGRELRVELTEDAAGKIAQDGGLFSFGLTAVAVLLALWLGARVGLLALSAFAWVVETLLLVGILITAFAVLPVAVRWALETLGIPEEEVKDWLQRVWDAFLEISPQILGGIAEKVREIET